MAVAAISSATAIHFHLLTDLALRVGGRRRSVLSVNYARPATVSGSRLQLPVPSLQDVEGTARSSRTFSHEEALRCRSTYHNGRSH
jgi:hypothetical protein